MNLTLQELEQRRARFVALMNSSFPDWDTALIIGNVNQYYFTGSIQNGILFIYRNGSCLYAVRRSFQRATMESPLSDIIPMTRYSDIVQIHGAQLGNTYLEGDTLPLSTLERLK